MPALEKHFGYSASVLLSNDASLLQKTKKAPTEAGAVEFSAAEVVQRYLLDKGFLKDGEEFTDVELEAIGKAMDAVAVAFRQLKSSQ